MNKREKVSWEINFLWHNKSTGKVSSTSCIAQEKSFNNLQTFVSGNFSIPFRHRLTWIIWHKVSINWYTRCLSEKQLCWNKNQYISNDLKNDL